MSVFAIKVLLFYNKCAIVDYMKSFKTFFTGVSTAITFAALKASTSFALSGVRSGVDAAHGEGQPTDLFGDGAIFSTIVDLMLFLIGAIAVVMIIFGGFRYVVSGGDSSAVTSAKNTILYAIIGVIVALLAYAIISFVLDSLAATTGGGL